MTSILLPMLNVEKPVKEKIPGGPVQERNPVKDISERLSKEVPGGGTILMQGERGGVLMTQKIIQNTITLVFVVQKIKPCYML